MSATPAVGAGSVLDGRVALVTGSSAGIGEAIVRRLAELGATVLVHGRDRDRTARVRDAIRESGGRAELVLGDLSTDDGGAAVLSAGLALGKGIDILVNNSGAYVNRTWGEATPSDWMTLYRANVVSMVQLINGLVPGMRERRWGRVIQLSSGEATAPFAFMPDYAATKAAIVNLTVSLSKELSGSGVTSNVVSPGIIVTDSVEKFYRQMARERNWGEDWDGIERHVLAEVWPCPAGRLGRVDDVASLVAFLASPAAGFCNGSNYRVDGGATGVVN